MSALANPSPLPTWVLQARNNLDVITRLGAIVIGAIYVMGFLVTNLHNCSMGIVDFSFAKAQIFSAGIFFCLLVTIPCAAATRLWRAFALNREGSGACRLSKKERSIVVCYLIPLSILLTFLCSPLFTGTVQIGWVPLVVWLASVLSLTVVMRYRGGLTAHLCVSSIGAVALVSAFVAEHEFAFLSKAAWFFICCSATIWISDGGYSFNKVLSYEWERNIGLFLAFITLFAVNIYGSGKPEVGGGHPIHIRVYLAMDAPKDLGKSPIAMWLVQQTDHGYYLVRNPSDHNAIYLDRALVKSAIFELNYQDK
jgi:hypothetical protein